MSGIQTSHIRLHLLHGQFYVVLLQCPPELQGKTYLYVAALNPDVGGQQSFSKTDTYLLVGYGMDSMYVSNSRS